MKTLIINGSPRKNGNTTALVNKLTDNLQGEYKTLNAYYCNISPCIDCRYCRDNIGCAINDEMQEIYDYILECDNIVIASPIYFSEITGRVLDFGSRLQTYFSAMHFRNEKPIIKIKKGAVILVGAGDGKPQKAYDTAVCLLHHMNAKEIHPIVCSFNTDNLPAIEDSDTIACVVEISKFFNISDSENNEPIKLNSSICIQDKINLYRSLFKGRDDVYAQRWYNPKTEKSGYSPICKNKWAPNVCNLPKIKCADCSYRSYLSVSDKVIFNHLSGKDELCRDVIGIYPMLPNETTFFLALDFDDDGWKDDLTAVREVCKGNNINAYAERSRSGNGAHLWIFFEAPIPAVKARKLGSGLLTLTMKKRHELKFESYDRMFPNQDTMPSGGFGNLIALPLQKQAVNKGNSVFIDDKFKPYPDQWTYLLNIKKHSGTEVEQFITSVCNESELGNLFKEEQINKPWEISILNINNENAFLI